MLGGPNCGLGNTSSSDAAGGTSAISNDFAATERYHLGRMLLISLRRRTPFHRDIIANNTPASTAARAS